MFPVSTGIEEIDSDRLTHLSVSAIPFNESFIDEKIELNVDPFEFPPCSPPAAAASSVSTSDWKSEIIAILSLGPALPKSTGCDNKASSLSIISLPLKLSLLTILSTSFSLSDLLIITRVGFCIPSIFS